MRTLFILAAVVSSAPIAAADSPKLVAAPTPRKTPETALWLSLGTTAVGLGLVLIGADVGIRPQAYPNAHWLEPVLAGAGVAALVVGPSLGQVYAGRLWNKGLAMRLGGLGIGAIGVAAALALAARDRSDPNAGGSLDMRPLVIGGGIAAIGAILYIVGSAREIAMTPSAVEHYNREHGLEATLTVASIRTRDGVAPGLALAGRF